MTARPTWMRWTIATVGGAALWALLWWMFGNPLLAMIGPAFILVSLAGSRVAADWMVRDSLAAVETIRTHHPGDVVFLAYSFIDSPFRRRRSWRVPLTGVADTRRIRLIPGRDDKQPSTSFDWDEVACVEPGLVQAAIKSHEGLIIVAKEPGRTVGVQVGGATPSEPIASHDELTDLIHRLELLRTGASQPSSP